MKPAAATIVVLAVTIAISATGCAATPEPSTTTSPIATAEDSTPAAAAFADISIYYPVALGNTWVYSIDYGNGSVVTDTEVMTKVTPEGDGARATIERTFTWDDKSQPDFTDSVEYIFNSDGSLSVPFQTLPNSGGTVTVNNGELVWPTTAEFEAGIARTGQITASINTDGAVTNETIDFTITGSGVEDVTVPAGTYTARKLLQNLLVSLPDLGVTGIAINSISWLAEDVGAVRTEVPAISGGPTIVQQLLRFTPGA